jgi:hypothetical protein
MIDVSFKGIKSVMKALDALDADMARAASDSIREAGIEVAKDAQALAPRDTGAYAKKIRSVFVNHKSSPFAKIASWLRGRPSPLGHLLEFGHRDRASGKFVPGKSHLLAALERHKARIRERIARGIAR